MSKQDQWQEYELIKLEHPEYQHYQIMRDVIDVSLSRKWADSWNNQFQHIPFRDSVSITTKIDTIIDFRIAISKLTKRQQVVIKMELNGYSRDRIANELKLSQRWITTIRKQAIKTFKEYYAKRYKNDC